MISNYQLSTVQKILRSTNFDAPYQRSNTWKEKDKSYYIESLFLNYAPHPIILSTVFEHNNYGNGKYNCLDGKQRSSAILGFLSGEFPAKIDGKVQYFTTMPDLVTVPILIYVGKNEKIEREIFTRINSGKSLTQLEKKNAQISPEMDLIHTTRKIHGEKLKIIAPTCREGITSILEKIITVNFPIRDQISSSEIFFNKIIRNLLHFVDENDTKTAVEKKLGFKIKNIHVLAASIIARKYPIIPEILKKINTECNNIDINGKITFNNHVELKKLVKRIMNSGVIHKIE